MTLEMGTDDSRDGPIYRSRVVKPGAPFALSTEGYEAAGVITSIEVPK